MVHGKCNETQSPKVHGTTKKWNDSVGEHEETNYFKGMPQLDIMENFSPVLCSLIPPTWESLILMPRYRQVAIDQRG